MKTYTSCEVHEHEFTVKLTVSLSLAKGDKVTPLNSSDELKKYIDELYEKMQRPEHRAATDALFKATAEELNASYQPGRTEVLLEPKIIHKE